MYCIHSSPLNWDVMIGISGGTLLKQSLLYVMGIFNLFVPT